MSQAERILKHLKSGEEFRQIPGFEGFYECSTHGAVRSMDRIVKHPSGSQKQWRGRVLKQSGRKQGGYLMVSLSKRGEWCTQSVHRLVAMTWLPNPDGCPHVAHLDGNPLNNDVTNLAWVTPAENEAHKLMHGRRRFGAELHNAVLSDSVVRKAREMASGGMKCHEIAKALALNYYTTWDVVRGRHWGHVR